jgi:tetratricopeptide (TPR) repeat protein
MIHEITHACLAHLTLPLWLEEGATQLAEEAGLANWARFQLDAETAKGMRDYWHENELSNFWWGKGFFLTDDAQMPSYQLAQVLFHLLLSDHRRQLPDFVRHAHAADAGDSSAREHLGKSVGDLAAQFLGSGSWEPVPPDVETYCGRAHLYLTRSQYGQAIADLDEALRLDPARSDAFSNRGFARQKTGDYAAARSDFERAIELDDKNFDAHNNLAWLLATCPDDNLRDGPRALTHAKRACELTGYGTWYCAGTLAAAYAEVGDFEEARTWARETVQQAPDDEREACKQRLKLYREGKPYRDVQNADVRPTATKTTNRMEL